MVGPLQSERNFQDCTLIWLPISALGNCIRLPDPLGLRIDRRRHSFHQHVDRGAR